MKLINYKCTECGKDTEVIVNNSEEAEETAICEYCGATAKEFNFKNNKYRWRFLD